MTAESSGAEADARGAIIEIEPGVAVVVGDAVPEGVELLPMDLIGPEIRTQMASSAASALGWGNVAVQTASGAVQAQGLLRFAPQSLDLIAKGAQPMMSGGQLTGNLVKDGKIVGHARLIAAGGAQATSIAASAGGALAMVAMQAQMAQIQRTAEENLKLTDGVFDAIKSDHWSQITGATKAINQAYDMATHVGAVTDSIMGGIRHLRPDLEAYVDRSQHTVAGHEHALSRAESHSARQQILQRPEVVRDAQALVLATEALRMFRLLEAANAALHAGEDEREARRRDRLVEQAETEGARQRERATALLADLRRELNLAATLSAPKRTLSFRERAASRANAASSAHLAAIVNDLGRRLGLTSVEPFIAPNRTAVDGAVPDAVLHGLPWVAGTPGERLIGFAEMNEASGLAIADIGRRRWVAVTDRTTYVMSPKTFESSAEIEHAIDNGDIRFVRVKKNDGRAPALTIVTTDDDLHLEFGSWAKDGEAHQAAESFAELLASLMRLPVEEVPVVEVPELDERPGAPRIER
ncbi:hypothetical protein [Dermacoccus nishinomiyaensis]|uniref:hypothetical protein n=1 Tax=Dermacoccus nishinomiyaensis TaxID=1274 RepID=UPI001EF6F124|nr:hypothetical protein [Dermacoccus nishinomiyaensis]MCG7429843.1 hypothetical protein [Dermacoccus nishinomiyaensis]